ncbi:MAG: AAA family ATPase [Planctomycetota bacterium]|nr:AAA family ATPase [Planctomycetota bacterium]
MASSEVHAAMVENLASWLGGAERIETHISTLLLTADRAYKLKKPLDLGFLDFSTLEKRRVACEDEVRLNRRTAPGLYLGVVEIRGELDAPRIGGTGPLLDHAVEMRRFDEVDRLDHMLTRGELKAHHADELADRIAEFHGSISRADGTQLGDAGTRVITPMRENFLELLKREQRPESKGALAQLAAWTERCFEAYAPMLTQRQADGFVRECHGDLHLGNIALVEGRVTPFDCIEFSAELRWSDVLCDLAFLTMDLDERGASQLSNRVLDRYLELTGDHAGLSLVRFYQVYRAMVRAKVCAIRLGQAQVDRKGCLKEYDAYLDLATRYMEPGRRRLILMHGVSASGKSWVSQELLERLGAIRVRSDRERKRLFPNQADPYDTKATLATYQRLLELCERILRADYPVIVDATFLKAEQREPFAWLAGQMDVPLTIVHTFAPPEILEQRLKDRASDKDNISDATASVLHAQLQSLEPFAAQESVVDWDTSKASPLPDLIAQLR